MTYRYTLHEVEGRTFWRCERPATDHPCKPGDVLWLFKCGDAVYHSVHTPASAEEAVIENSDNPVSCSADDQVLQAGPHAWLYFGDDGQWAPLGTFKTTIQQAR